MENAHEHKDHPKYFQIFLWLAVLTIIEVVVAIPEYSQALKAIVLIALACVKAALVALYFMHLKLEQKTLAIIVLTPLIICIFLVIMLLPDLLADNRDKGPTEATTETVAPH